MSGKRSPTGAFAVLFFYKVMLRLYPSEFQQRFRDEMLDILETSWRDNGMGHLFHRFAVFIRETGGMLRGAIGEWGRRILGAPRSRARTAAWFTFLFGFGTMFRNLVLFALSSLQTDSASYTILDTVVSVLFSAVIGLGCAFLLRVRKPALLTGLFAAGSFMRSLAFWGAAMLLGWQDADFSTTTLSRVAAESIIGGMFGVLVGLAFHLSRRSEGSHRWIVVKAGLAFLTGSALAGIRFTLPYSFFMKVGETPFLIQLLLIATVSSMATGFLLGWPAAGPSSSLDSAGANTPAPGT